MPLKTRIIITVAVFAVVLTVLGIVANKSRLSLPAKSETDVSQADSFTFFGLGEDSVFSRQQRSRLREALGPDVVDQWRPLNLEPHYRGYLAEYFPGIDSLNTAASSEALKTEAGRKTIKVRYRYARNKDLPFYFIELVFSDITKKPLFFTVKYKKDGNGSVLKTLHEKYGEPSSFKWASGKGKSEYWEKKESLLIASEVPDRYGKPEIHIFIYYTGNLKDLLNTIDIEQKDATGAAF